MDARNFCNNIKKSLKAIDCENRAFVFVFSSFAFTDKSKFTSAALSTPTRDNPALKGKFAPLVHSLGSYSWPALAIRFPYL